MATNSVRLPDGTVLHFEKDSLRQLGSDRDVVVEPDRDAPWDDHDAGATGLSTYQQAEAHGPEPIPGWVITADGARQREHHMIRSGKEANVWLVERAVDDRRNLLAAKRYRRAEHRTFADDYVYAAGRRTGDRRVDLAIAKGTRRGRQFARQQWVSWEFSVLCRAWEAGIAVPYPVQRYGTEIMLEYLGDEQGPAPRLCDLRPDRGQLRDYYQQSVRIVLGLARLQIVHADLSPFNLLVWHDRVYAIDMPQTLDYDRHPNAPELLARDVTTLAEWFVKRGLPVDVSRLVAQAQAAAAGP